MNKKIILLITFFLFSKTVFCMHDEMSVDGDEVVTFGDGGDDVNMVDGDSIRDRFFEVLSGLDGNLRTAYSRMTMSTGRLHESPDERRRRIEKIAQAVKDDVKKYMGTQPRYRGLTSDDWKFLVAFAKCVYDYKLCLFFSIFYYVCSEEMCQIIGEGDRLGKSNDLLCYLTRVQSGSRRSMLTDKPILLKFAQDFRRCIESELEGGQ